MKSTRHPHPHIDPRQPRNGSAPRTNPPVFAWKPDSEHGDFRLVVARDPNLTDTVLDLPDLNEPMYLPTQALAPGKYYWKWCDESELFSFEITSEAVALEVPPAKNWLPKFPSQHPRIWIRPEELSDLRASRTGVRAEQWATLKAHADALLSKKHEIEEPPFLPDWKAEYEAAFASWHKILQSSRRFVGEALALALAYTASGEAMYARAACRRMASICKWDPEGSSHLAHNDEAHMSLLWDGPQVCDWVWDQFTDEERACVIEQYRHRGQITFDYMHNKELYGIARFDSHAGREIVFLAQIALVFHDEIPEAKTWLEWLRPVLCGAWPIWSTDGAWAEGPAYSFPYVAIMTFFTAALKRGAGIDLYRRPFWQGYADWLERCVPAYAEWIGFGDHTERWRSFWRRATDLVTLIDRETDATHSQYAAQLHEAAETCISPPERRGPAVSPLPYLVGPIADSASTGRSDTVLRVFEGTGWASIRRDLSSAERDLALIFRSSPYGSVSHSHASNNDFILHVAGKVMLQPSGYYDGYGSPHHNNWNAHTKSHNCVTLSGASQLLKSYESTGEIRNAFENDDLAYMVGVADASYKLQASRCRRHVIYLKAKRAFVLVDEFVAQEGIRSAFEWNLHSWAEFQTDDESRTFSVEREGSQLTGHLMCHQTAFFSTSEGFDPPPLEIRANEQWRPQHHLRFTVNGFPSRYNFGVILVPAAEQIAPPTVTTENSGETEIARIDDDCVVTLNQGQPIATIHVGESTYEISDNGIAGAKE